MAQTFILLDKQAKAKVFPFGTTLSGGDALVTIHKGTAAASTVVLDVKGSQSIAGDLNLTGDLNITGAINQTTVNNLEIKDKNITLNIGGTDANAVGAGFIIEGTGAIPVAMLLWDGAKWVAGDGDNQYEIILSVGAQTLNDKTMNDTVFTGTVSGLTQAMVGLDQVDNVADINKVISNATQAALDLKVDDSAFADFQVTNQGALDLKSNLSYVTDELALKADLSDYNDNKIVVDASLDALNTNKAELSYVNDELALKVDANSAITAGTKTKITYDAKGLVTGGEDATTSDIAEGSNLYFTDARVIAAPLTGFVASTDTAISATDSVKEAFEKVQAQLNTKGAAAQYFRAVSVTGDLDGVNKVFTIGNTLLTGSEQVFVNGTILNPGGANEYIISGTTVTLQAAMYAPDADAVVRIYGVY